MDDSIRPDASTKAKLTSVKTKRSNAKRRRVPNPFVVDTAGSCVNIFIVCKLLSHLVSVNFYQKAIASPSPNGDIVNHLGGKTFAFPRVMPGLSVRQSRVT